MKYMARLMWRPKKSNVLQNMTLLKRSFFDFSAPVYLSSLSAKMCFLFVRKLSF